MPRKATMHSGGARRPPRRRSIRLFRERVRDGFHVHADGFLSDGRTLCGYAFEGECLGPNSDGAVEEIDGGTITCGTCRAIIRYCKKIPPKMLIGEIT